VREFGARIPLCVWHLITLPLERGNAMAFPLCQSAGTIVRLALLQFGRTTSADEAKELGNVVGGRNPWGEDIGR
jgi:hypothetical protein